jgi:carbon storage regulator CsrA
VGTLVLARKDGEEVILTVHPSRKPVRIVVRVTETHQDTVKLGFVAPEDSVDIWRAELQDRIDREGRRR